MKLARRLCPLCRTETRPIIATISTGSKNQKCIVHSWICRPTSGGTSFKLSPRESELSPWPWCQFRLSKLYIYYTWKRAAGILEGTKVCRSPEFCGKHVNSIHQPDLAGNKRWPFANGTKAEWRCLCSIGECLWKESQRQALLQLFWQLIRILVGRKSRRLADSHASYQYLQFLHCCLWWIVSRKEVRLHFNSLILEGHACSFQSPTLWPQIYLLRVNHRQRECCMSTAKLCFANADWVRLGLTSCTPWFLLRWTKPNAPSSSLHHRFQGFKTFCAAKWGRIKIPLNWPNFFASSKKNGWLNFGELLWRALFEDRLTWPLWKCDTHLSREMKYFCTSGSRSFRKPLLKQFNGHPLRLFYKGLLINSQMLLVLSEVPKPLINRDSQARRLKRTA